MTSQITEAVRRGTLFFSRSNLLDAAGFYSPQPGLIEAALELMSSFGVDDPRAADAVQTMIDDGQIVAFHRLSKPVQLPPTAESITEAIKTTYQVKDIDGYLSKDEVLQLYRGGKIAQDTAVSKIDYDSVTMGILNREQTTVAAIVKSASTLATPPPELKGHDLLSYTMVSAKRNPRLSGHAITAIEQTFGASGSEAVGWQTNLRSKIRAIVKFEELVGR